jgi:phosphohistidine swiveling domain-containing protein
MVSQRFTTALVDCRDANLIGGKAANLGALIRAGFPVPDGFVVDAHAYRLAHASVQARVSVVPPEVAEEVRWRYQHMGRGLVAVRSSATVEDMPAASMAGQCETFLNIEGDDAVVGAVAQCWESLHAERTCAYLREHDIDPSLAAMAVVIQRLVPADAAGVLFTADPNGGRQQMLIEANWGLGETVVGGRVQPDVLRLDATNGRVLSASIADKTVYLSAGIAEEQAVEETRRTQPCVTSRDVYNLWQLGRRAEQYFGAPQDIEWAISDSKLFLLQARPITTHVETEAAFQVVTRTRDTLRQNTAAGRGPWVLHSLAETLPHPTALTWSVIERFMSASGGWGEMYRRVGFQPSPALDRDGFLELIAGRVYMDASRAPEMFCSGFPFAYDVPTLVRDPEATQKPPSVPRGSISNRLKASKILSRASRTVESLSAHADTDFRGQTASEIDTWVRQSRERETNALSTEQLIAAWHDSERHVFDVVGPATFLPSLICGMVWADLEDFLREYFWDDSADALALAIAAGGEPDRTVLADAELFEVARGTRSLESWIAAHGHRGPEDFDLSSKRWREQPDQLRDLASRLATGEPPLERFRRACDVSAQQAADLRSRLDPAPAREFDRRLALVRRYMPFREEGKDYFMFAYDELRKLVVEMSRRLNVDEGVFHLTSDEICDALRVGFAPHHLIEERRLHWRAEIELTLPRVIDGPAIERIGEPVSIEMAAGACAGLSLSAGRASGAAQVLHSPTESGNVGTGYVLVCPSTDTAWTPLFVNAVGLVLERGGTLSHGAVVAREMGLPAVVISDATRRFRTGEQLDVDGNNGFVTPASARGHAPSAADAPVDPSDTRIPAPLVPPPPSARDRRAALWRTIALGFWSAYVLAFFFLPKGAVHDPSMRLLDVVLWPAVRAWGSPAVVALVAFGVAAVTLVVQRLVTDNRALLEARRRAAILTEQAKSLPADSPRRDVIQRLTAPVSGRVAAARLIPVCLLLGPLMLPFAWFEDRVDPSTPYAAAGSAVQVVATVDGEWTGPIRINIPSDAVLDDTTPATRTLPPLRQTLEHLLVLYRQPAVNRDVPWELQVAPDISRMQMAGDLKRYLDRGVSPQGLTWTVRSPSDDRRFPVSVVADGHSPLGLDVVLGNTYPPADVAATGPADSPIKELRVVYPGSLQRRAFWQPFATLGLESDSTLVNTLAGLDIGWLWLYLMVYVPALVLVRRLLHVA